MASMNSTSAAGQFLKTDVLGRVRTPPARRRELLDEFERSGISGAEFARIVGVNYQAFASWVQGRRKRRGGYSKAANPPSGKRSTRPKSAAVRVPPARWIEAVAVNQPGSKAGSALVIELPGGAAMRVNDSAQAALAARLIQALQKEPPAC